MIADLKRYFPTTPNKDVADILGVSERTLIRKARELGINKTREFTSERATEKSRYAVIARRKINNYGRNNEY